MGHQQGTIANTQTGRMALKTITKVAVLSAISVIVMLFEIPLPFAPGFYKVDLSEVVVMIGALAMGVVPGIFIELIKVLLNLLINGTITAGVGELANFVIGCSYIVPAALIYRHRKTLKTAIVGMSVGTVSITVVGALMNLFVLLPAYSALAGMPLDTLVGMGTAVNPAITNVATLVLFATVPFNLLKGLVSSVLVLLLYKRLSPILHR